MIASQAGTSPTVVEAGIPCKNVCGGSETIAW
jgi:hypothetical protein